MSSLEFFERAVSISSKEFIRGFLIGQVSLLIILVVLARLLFFRGPQPATIHIGFHEKCPLSKRKSRPLRSSGGEEALCKLAHQLGLPEDRLLPRRETCFWLNALAKSALFEPLRRSFAEGELVKCCGDLLNGQTAKTDLLGPIEITRLELGEQDPLLKWAELVEWGRLNVRLEWSEAATLDVDTMLLLGWSSQHQIASLPCSFSFTIRSFAATVRLEIEETATRWMASVLPEDFILEVEIHTLLGHRSKLKDVPKLTNLLQTHLRRAIEQSILWPRRIALTSDRLLSFFLKSRPI